MDHLINQKSNLATADLLRTAFLELVPPETPAQAAQDEDGINSVRFKVVTKFLRKERWAFFRGNLSSIFNHELCLIYFHSIIFVSLALSQNKSESETKLGFKNRILNPASVFFLFISYEQIFRIQFRGRMETFLSKIPGLLSVY